jgi:LysW-gamma-L-lysine carboxypeptidase
MLGVGYWVTQPSGHSAGPHPSPAEMAVAFWNSLKSYEEAHNAGVRGRFDALHASLRGFQTFGDGLEDGAFMDIGIRLPPGFRVELLKRRLRIWGGEARIVLESSYPPYVADKNTSLIRALLKAIRAQGGKPRFKLKTGTADMNTLGTAWDCPVAAYGPGDSTLDHTPQEHVEIEELRRGVDVVARAIEILGTGFPSAVPGGR